MNRNPRDLSTRAAAVLALLWALAAPAHAESAREIARGLRVNQQLLQDFSWKSRAEFKVNGKTKDVQLFDVRYDIDGGVLATQTDTEADRRPRRANRGISPGLKTLIDAYTYLTPDTLKDLFGKATIQPGAGDDGDLIRVQAENVKSLGDRVDIWVDRATRRPRRSEVVTAMDGQAVRIETEFAQLDGGAAYPARTEVHTEVKSRPATVSIENFQFVLQGG